MTLIEILTVVAIIGVLVGVSIPAYQTFIPSAKLNSAFSLVSSSLRQAQSKALETQQTQTVVFSSITLPTSVKFNRISFSGGAVSWNSQGLPDEAGEIVLEINGHSKKIEITSTGYIK